MTGKAFSLFQKKYPEIAQCLKEESFQRFKRSKTRKGEENLCYRQGEKIYYLHSNYSARQESQKWCRTLDLEKYDVIVIFGLGLGYSFDALLPWLEESPKRQLLYLEDSLGVLEEFLKTKRAEKVLSHSRIRLECLDGTEQDKMKRFSELALHYVDLKVKIAALPHYDMHRHQEYLLLLSDFRKSLFRVMVAENEVSNFGGVFYKNFYNTALSLERSHVGEKLRAAFPSIPAVICGAGPSLRKNAPILKTLQDKALIIAAGSGISALNSYGIEPHLGGMADPHPLQYERNIAHSFFDLPIIYKSRLSDRAFHSIHGPRIFSYGNPAYPLSNWFEQKLGLQEHVLDEGMTMQQHLTEWACFMGCDPIIFVGIDLAFTDKQRYVSGVVDTIQADKKALSEGSMTQVKDIYGNVIYTLPKWMQEAEYSSFFPQKYPKNRFINATEGGLGIEGIPNETLEEVAEKYCQRPFSFAQLLHTKIQQTNKQYISFTKIKEAYSSIVQESQELVSVSKKLKALLERVKRSFEREDPEAVGELFKQYDTIHAQKLENSSYQKIVYPLNYTRTRMLNRWVTEVDADRELASDFEKGARYCDVYLNEAIYDLSAIESNLEMMMRSVGQSCLHGYTPSYPLLRGIQKKKEEAVIAKTQGESFSRGDKKESYSFESRKLIIEDEDLGIFYREEFDPVYLPESLKEGLDLGQNSSLRLQYGDDLKKVLISAEVLQGGQACGQRRSYYSNGSVESESFMCLHQGKSVLHGPYRTFSKEGKLLSEQWFVRGRVQGKSWQYYLSGKLYQRLQYKDGSKHLEQQTFYENGVLKTLVPYEEGEIQGESLLYYRNGQVFRRIPYEKGQRQGIEKEWNPKGSLLAERVYSQGFLKEERRWNGRGVLLSERVFLDDSFKLNFKKWSHSGRLRIMGVYRGEQMFYRQWSEEGKLQIAFYGNWDGSHVIVDKIIKGNLNESQASRLCQFEVVSQTAV